MAILSIDLAYKNYADIGAVILEECNDSIVCEMFPKGSSRRT